MSTVLFASSVFSSSPSKTTLRCSSISCRWASSKFGRFGSSGGMSPGLVVNIQEITCSVPVANVRFVGWVRSIGFSSFNRLISARRSSGVKSLRYANGAFVSMTFSMVSLIGTGAAAGLTSFANPPLFLIWMGASFSISGLSCIKKRHAARTVKTTQTQVAIPLSKLGAFDEIFPASFLEMDVTLMGETPSFFRCPFPFVPRSSPLG